MLLQICINDNYLLSYFITNATFLNIDITLLN